MCTVVLVVVVFNEAVFVVSHSLFTYMILILYHIVNFKFQIFNFCCENLSTGFFLGFFHN